MDTNRHETTVGYATKDEKLLVAIVYSEFHQNPTGLAERCKAWLQQMWPEGLDTPESPDGFWMECSVHHPYEFGWFTARPDWKPDAVALGTHHIIRWERIM